MYRMTEKILNEYGYDKYEDFKLCKSQVLKADIILGIGPIFLIWEWGLNASSYLDEKRFENPSDMKDYLEIQSFGDAYEGARSLSVYEQMEEFMFLGLRKDERHFEERVYRTFWLLHGFCLWKAIDRIHETRHDERRRRPSFSDARWYLSQ